jgi:ribonuclease PH
MTRPSGRAHDALRTVTLQTRYLDHHPGSVLVSFGKTRVLTVCTVEERVPPFRMQSGGGWLTASYTMLPASTHQRRPRDNMKPDGRSLEIQRLVGRALRNVVDIDRLGQRTLHIDCDVIQADGGTRTASITGAYVAVRLAVDALVKNRSLAMPERDIARIVTGQVAAVSIGLIGGKAALDLDYQEDSKADTDLNLVGRADGSIVEVQGTAEGKPMQRSELDALIDMGLNGIRTLAEIQNQAIADAE